MKVWIYRGEVLPDQPRGEGNRMDRSERRRERGGRRRTRAPQNGAPREPQPVEAALQPAPVEPALEPAPAEPALEPAPIEPALEPAPIEPALEPALDTSATSGEVGE